MMTVFAGHSQPSDAVWIPRIDALRRLAQADSLPVFKQLVGQKDVDIKILNDRVANLERLIGELNALDAANVSTIAAYKKEIEELKSIRTLMEADYKTISKQLKKQKRKTFWTAIAGILATAGSIWLLK